jgi:hypothetical protein
MLGKATHNLPKTKLLKHEEQLLKHKLKEHITYLNTKQFRFKYIFHSQM